MEVMPVSNVLTREQRHLNMSHLRGKDTKPEEIVRKYLFSKGYRYRKNDSRCPSKPDHRSSEIPYDDFRTWLFLAQASRMQIRYNAIHEPRLLAEEVRPECCKGQEGTGAAEGGRLACDSRLGMRDFQKSRPRGTAAKA